MHMHCIIHVGVLIHPFLGKRMGTNQNGKRFYQVKVKGLDVTSIKEVEQSVGSPDGRKEKKESFSHVEDTQTFRW